MQAARRKNREKNIIGHTEDGERVSLRTQRADAKKVLRSVHKMDTGGNVVALDGDKSHMQKRGRTKIPGSTPSTASASCAFGRRRRKETEKVLKGQSLRDIGRGE